MRLHVLVLAAVFLASCALSEDPSGDAGARRSSSNDSGVGWVGWSGGSDSGFGGGGGGVGTGGGSGGGDIFPMPGVDSGCLDPKPDPELLLSSAVEPLPVTGSTVLVSRFSPYAVAVNADVGLVYFVHLPSGSTPRSPALDSVVELSGWPFKPVEDDQGLIHVLLRSTGELASITPATRTVRRTAICANPRGLFSVPGADRLLIACAEGLLIDVRASTGALLSRRDAPVDLRDVVVSGGRTFVTTFRAAEFFEAAPASDGGTQFLKLGTGLGDADAGFVPAVAWKTVAIPDGLLMAHQRATASTVSVSCAGYGGTPGGGRSIVQAATTALLVPADGGAPSTRDVTCAPGFFEPFVLPVDINVSPDAGTYVIAGAATFNSRLVTRLSTTTCITLGTFTSLDAGITMARRALGVAITSDDRIVTLTDEPAVTISQIFSSGPTNLGMSGPAEVVPLRPPNGLTYPRTTGHRLFHKATLANLACASCHPEGHDDARVWTFAGIGPRRTQNLSGGISSTAPFHWDGDMVDFNQLMTEVMGRRMLGPFLDDARRKAVLDWVETIPAARAKAKDAAAVSRGKTLFESSAVGCTSCHSGAKRTNNASANVGTGKSLQVPPLIGLGTRTPFMHDGCAKTLRDRFGPCGGGDQHGTTSQLSPAQIDDLVAYLETL